MPGRWNLPRASSTRRPLERALPLALVVGMAGVVGCVTEVPEDPGTPTEGCVPTETYFQDEVWNAFMGSTCYACHNSQGQASHTDLVLVGSNTSGYMERNLETVEEVASLERDGVSYILLKPSGQIDHGGGQVIEVGSEPYVALEGLVERFKNPVECEVIENDDFFDDVDVIDNEATVRKAAVALVGRLPTDDELAQVRDGDEADIDAVLDGMLEEPAFYATLKEWYNDLFLTNRYLGNNRATDLLDQNDFPNKYYYQQLDEAEFGQDYIDNANRYTNNSVAQAPLELVVHVVKNDLPFSEILTADYMMVNGYSAQVYGVSGINFTDPSDPNEFRPAQVEGVPHAGILTDPMWLNRFPTTDTNRNRHRSRMVFNFFMAQDVMRLAERPVDPTSITGHNPTMNNPSCNVCHANIDPVAGAFQNWDAQGRYRPPEEGWYADMRPPGLGETFLPQDQYGSSLQWLARQIANNELFALSAVHEVYTGLTGQKPLLPPPADIDAAQFAAATEAFTQQDKLFKDVAADFRENGMNLKDVVKALVKSPWFRADGLRRAPSESRALEVRDVGTARWLTPELLDRKIEAVLGRRWTRGYDQTPYLLSSNEFLIFFGGIDSDNVTERIREPNGLMSSIAIRMANEMACATVARDFTRLPEDRLLFPSVETTYEPFDVNGFEITGAVEAIKANIQHLHRRILGEDLRADDPEILRTYDLFVQTLLEGQEKRSLEEPTVERDIDYSCRATTDPYTGEDLPQEQQVSRDDRYVIRSWMAVVTYLLSDYRFLHE